jgi:hypothetical protein
VGQHLQGVRPRDHATSQDCLRAIELLEDGTSFEIRATFNEHAIGRDVYQKQSDRVIVIREEGALAGLFATAPFVRKAEI